MSTQDDDFARELEAHLEHEADELVAQGLDPETARRSARVTFGSVTRTREDYRERRRLTAIDHLGQDLKGALRGIRRYPIAALVAVLSLGAGIGATTITLSIRNILFRKAPFGYRDPGQLTRVQVGRPESPIQPIGSPVPSALYSRWQALLDPNIGGSAPETVREVRSGTSLETVAVRAVTPNLFGLLGVEPIIGQQFSRDANSTSAILSHRVWQQLFDGQQDVVGRLFWIDNRPFTVVGVMPERFWYANMNSPIWIALDPRRFTADDALDVVVRRPAGTTTAMLDTILRPGLDDYASQLPMTQRRLLIGLSDMNGTPLARQMAFVLPYVLGASVLLTLLIACANVAVLMIAQWTSREQEIAIRAAIGASRGRIVRALLTESIVLATMGGLLGVGVTLGLRSLILYNSGASGFYDLSIDISVLVWTAVITLLTGIVAGVAPALYETRRLHANPLRTMASSDRVRQRWRHALVVFEITVTVALLVQTMSLVNGYRRAMSGIMGFETEPLLTLRVENPAGVNARRMLEVLQGIHGVDNAAASTALPFSARGPNERVAISAAGDNTVVAERTEITPTFFTTLGVALRAGRPFADNEPAAMHTAIVNDALARRLFGDRPAVGAKVWLGGATYDVVGLAADYSRNPMQDADAQPRVFLPLPDSVPRRLSFVIRSTDPAPLAQTIRREARDAVVGNLVFGGETFAQVFRVIGQEMLVGTAPLIPLITIGVLLTMAGIYGVLTFAVSRRARELAIRIAIGASGHDLSRLVTMHTVRLVGLGAGIGIGVTFALGRVVRAAGGGGSMFDPTASAFIVPAVVIFMVGAIATWIPARRAARIDPLVILRSGE